MTQGRLLRVADLRIPLEYRPAGSATQRLLATVYPAGLLALTAATAIAAQHTQLLLIPLAILVVEVLFYVWFRLVHLPRISQHAPSQHTTTFDPLEAFDRFISGAPDIARYMSIESCLSRWFRGAPFSEIRRGNVQEFLAYGFCYSTREELTARGLGHLPAQMTTTLEATWGVTFPPGYNPRISFMAHLWEPLRHHPRPLTAYLLVEAATLLKHHLLLRAGFRTLTINSYRVYHTLPDPLPSPSPSPTPATPTPFPTPTPATPAPTTPTPILFLHGIGLGLTPYLLFVRLLAATPHPVVALEFRHLSMLLTPPTPPVDTLADVAAAAMTHLGLPSAAVVAHSYGTFTASRLLQRHPERVSSLTLIDPVAFCMFTGHLIHNFVYRTPNPRDGLGTFLSNLSTWAVSRDPHSAAAVARSMQWSLVNLWPEQLPPCTLVVLAGQDLLVPTPEVATMLRHEAPNVPVMLHPEHGHADFLVDRGWQRKIVERVLGMLEAQQQQQEQGLAAAGGGHGVQVHTRHDSASSYVFESARAGAKVV